MSPWASRIQSLLDAGAANGLSVPDLARACGVKQPSVWQWFNDTDKKQATKMISGDNLVAAASYLNTTAEWIMTGKGPSAASQLSRFDPAILDAAIDLIVRTDGELTFANLIRVHDGLADQSAVADSAEARARRNRGRGTDAERASGALKNAGRKGNREEAG